MIMPLDVALWFCLAFIIIGVFCWSAADLDRARGGSKKWPKFWIGWIIFWFLPIGFRVLISAFLG